MVGGGLALSFEKFVMDADQLGAIRETGPDQHFLGSANTLANFESAFYRSDVADNAGARRKAEMPGEIG